MAPRLGFVAALSSLLIIAAIDSSPAVGAEPPRPTGLTESVTIDLAQIEVTAWPTDSSSDACTGLTASDFELIVDGKPRPIYSVDPLGGDEDAYAPDAPPAIRRSGSGLSLVLLFDLWHLDLFYRDFDACPRTKPLAFEQARRLVREQFRSGDRLLLVTSAGWPIVHYGWITSPREAMAAIDRLERNRQVMSPRQEHESHLGWIQGMESLFLALGRYPGRKDVIYLADDFRFDDVAARMYEIAGRAQVNGVVVSAVDLLATCRAVPGPGCPQGHSGGLACTEFRSPVALSPLSRDTGGELFLHERLDDAVVELRRGRRCRYLVSFRRLPQERKRAPVVTIRLAGDRPGVALHAPSSFETPREAPSASDRDAALFLLPRFGRGIAVRAALWPYRPAGKDWKALVLARVERTDDEPWPEDLTEIRVDVLLHEQSRIFGKFTKTIAGKDLADLSTGARERLLVFPVDKIAAGEASADVTVTANVEGISANARREASLPRPPGAGEAQPWFVSNRVVRFGDLVLRAPSLDDTIAPGEPASILGYACRPEGDAPRSYAGTLKPLAGGAPVPVGLAWLETPNRAANGCGWLAGTLPPALPAGTWTFEPPAGLTASGSAAVEFTVLPAAGESRDVMKEIGER